MKVLIILGARPQFIKASVISRALREGGALHEVVVRTGQHFDANMSGVFFDELRAPVPAHSLGIHGGQHDAMTGRMLAEIERVLLAERPAAVLVYGDTNSTLAGFLAAVKLHIPVAHVEAGLRSFNLAMPEEVIRILTDRVARWLFTPTEAAVRHLRSEGVAAMQVGPIIDAMYDVALHHGPGGCEWARALYARPCTGQLCARHRAPCGEHRQCAAARNHRRCAESDRGKAAGGLAAAPARPRRAIARRPVRPARHPPAPDRPGGLPRHGAARETRCRGRHRFRRRAEGGLFLPRDLRDLGRRNRVGRVGGRGLESARGADVWPYGEGDAAQRIVQRLVADLGA